MRHARLAPALLVAIVTVSLAAQEPPKFRGATVTTIRAAGDLRRQIVSLDSSGERAWAGYSIPIARTRRVEICCSYRCGSCSLDRDDVNITNVGDDDFAGSVAILYRVENGAITKIRPLGSCGVDASGARIYWIEGVDPRASIDMLSSLAKGNASITNRAILALSLHDGATDALIDLAHFSERSKVRSDALFWLAQTAGEKAAATLRNAVDNDPDEEVRGRAVFGIAQLPNDQSIPLLSELMRTHRSKNVRKKAAFWLGQKNDPRALQEIESFLRQ
jgi:hypothetical protein